MLVDRLEKLGRLLLWVTVSCGIVAVSIGTVLAAQRNQGEADRLREDLKAAQRELTQVIAAQPKAPVRLALTSMRPFVWGLDTKTATGSLYFANVSPHSGVVCVLVTVAQNESGEKTRSAPVCKAVEPYQSNVEIVPRFIWSELDRLCGTKACKFDDVKDINDNVAPLLNPPEPTPIPVPAP